MQLGDELAELGVGAAAEVDLAPPLRRLRAPGLLVRGVLIAAGGGAIGPAPPAAPSARSLQPHSWVMLVWMVHCLFPQPRRECGGLLAVVTTRQMSKVGRAPSAHEIPYGGAPLRLALAVAGGALAVVGVQQELLVLGADPCFARCIARRAA